jgi:inner membrane protein
MLIAHLPAGYLLTSWIERRAGIRSRAVMAAGLAGSILPDLDLLWFYGVSDRRTPHHDYVTHAPLAWMAAGLVAWAAVRLAGWRRGPLLVGVVLANVLLHLALDTVVGGIRWLWPLDGVETKLVAVPHRFDFWPWNFVLHWTFALELLIVACAAWACARRRPVAVAA